MLWSFVSYFHMLIYMVIYSCEILRCVSPRANVNCTLWQLAFKLLLNWNYEYFGACTRKKKTGKKIHCMHYKYLYTV